MSENDPARSPAGSGVPADADKPLHTVKETAARLRRSVPTVRRMIRSGELAAVRVGSGRGRPCVLDSAITAYLNRRAIAPSVSHGDSN